MRSPNAEQVVAQFLQQHEEALKRIHATAFLVLNADTAIKVGRELVAGWEKWKGEWAEGHCAVCGMELYQNEPFLRRPDHFNQVCGDHWEFASQFDLALALRLRSMPPPVVRPDYWEQAKALQHQQTTP